MMTTTRSPWQGSLVLALALALAAVAPGAAIRAQEEAEAEEPEQRGFGTLFGELATWISQPTGLDYTPVTVSDPLAPYDARAVEHTFGTETRMRTRVGYGLPKRAGTLMLTYFSHDSDSALERFRPGQFVFGAINAHPLFAGAFDDGFADAFESSTATRLRDLRLDFYRPAFRTAKVRADWFAGLRRVEHERRINDTYYSVLPTLPPLLPSRPDLLPLPDSSTVASQFDGRGLEAGMDFTIPLLGDKLALEAGFVVAVLRGDLDTEYRSTSWFYACEDEAGCPSPILSAPFSEFTGTYVNDQNQTVALIDSISQQAFQIGLRSDGLSSDAQVLETNLGLRWNAWRALEVFVGFRNARYMDVGADVRQASVTAFTGVNLVDSRRIERSAGYEGFYAGVAYSY